MYNEVRLDLKCFARATALRRLFILTVMHAFNLNQDGLGHTPDSRRAIPCTRPALLRQLRVPQQGGGSLRDSHGFCVHAHGTIANLCNICKASSSQVAIC